MGDISSVIQVLALGGFLAGFAGIALVVAATSQGRSARSGVVLAVAGIVAGLVLMVVSQGLLVVGPTERAVVFNTLSGDLEDPRESGIHIIIPGVQQTFMYPISQQNYTMSDASNEGQRTGADAIRARSVDGQEVRIDVTILFRLFDTKDQLNTIHRDWSNEPGGYTEGLIRPALSSIIRDVVAGFAAEAIYGTGREDMQAQIDERIGVRLQASGIEVTDLLVRDINFSEEFINSIEAKQVEEQALQRAVTEAERRRAEATGLADADIERARGGAESRLIEARAEAEALRLISQQIAANPSLIQYSYIQNLSDNVNIALVPSNSPFLFDFDSLSEANADFRAPEVPEVNIDEITGEGSEDSSGN